MSRKIFRSLKTVSEVWEIINKNYIIKQKIELINVDNALGRTISENIYSGIDVPGFDRASMDGFAVIAEDTFGVDETAPNKLKIKGRVEAGEQPNVSISKGECVEISTGAPLPKGANAVVMVEFTSKTLDFVEIFKPISIGENIQSTGSDIMCGELILRNNQIITSREIGVLSAVGIEKVNVYSQPKIGIISTGNEIIKIGADWQYGKIYDINSHTIMAAVRESGGIPEHLGILKDNKEKIRAILNKSLEKYDIILTSGSTSAGIGDVMYNLFNELGEPGVLVHGIAVKPGKPTIIALIKNTLIIGLPGYPTSALSIFNLFVKPIIMKLSGKILDPSETIEGQISQKIVRSIGRKELLPINLVKKGKTFSAYPIIKGSGSITTLSEADGFIEIPENKTILEEGEKVIISLLPNVKPANLMIIGSHCVGIDLLLELIKEKSDTILTKVINVGSLGGINAIKRGEADIAGIHVLDENTSQYNKPIYIKENLEKLALLVRGYTRLQGIILPKGNPEKIIGLSDIIDKKLFIINRTKGSGTRILLDIFLKKLAKKNNMDFLSFVNNIPGYNIEAKTHQAVAVAVKYGKADAGIGVKSVADFYDLHFIPLIEENYDFLIPKERFNNFEITTFLDLLKSNNFKKKLHDKLNGYKTSQETGQIILPSE